MNSRNLKDLHPYLVEAFNYADAEWDKLYPNEPNPILVQTYRSVEFQNMLYKQGRVTLAEINIERKQFNLPPLKAIENKVVTNAKGGSSKHNKYPSEAFDIAFVKVGSKQLDYSKRLFKMFYLVISTKYPDIFWGGYFRTLPDYPHFQK